MGIPVLIIGKSGSGKSTSLRNFTEADNIGIINVAKKPLPFRNSFKTFDSDESNLILQVITKAKSNTIIVDDAGYIMTNMFMKQHSNAGKGNAVFGLYNDIGDSFWRLISAVPELPNDKIVYFFMHEDKNDFGDIKPKSIGRMLDEKVCIEGMFTIVLRCKDHKFFTQAYENDIAKSPMGMFDMLEIDNDLKYVDETIREYYGLKKN